TPNAVHDLHGQLETQVHALGPDMEENVARCGNGMARAGANLLKRMKLGRTRRTEELVPGIRSKSGDTGNARLNVAKLNSTHQSREVGAKSAQMRDCTLVLPDAQHQKNRGPRKRTNHSLRKNNLVEFVGGVHFSNSRCFGFT